MFNVLPPDFHWLQLLVHEAPLPASLSQVSIFQYDYVAHLL